MSAATDRSRAAAWGVLRSLSGLVDARLRADGRALSGLAVHVWSNRSMDVVARTTTSWAIERPADVSDAAVPVRVWVDGRATTFWHEVSHAR